MQAPAKLLELHIEQQAKERLMTRLVGYMAIQLWTLMRVRRMDESKEDCAAEMRDSLSSVDNFKRAHGAWFPTSYSCNDVQTSPEFAPLIPTVILGMQAMWKD
jgi:hypothetical protein